MSNDTSELRARLDRLAEKARDRSTHDKVKQIVQEVNDSLDETYELIDQRRRRLATTR